MARNRKSISFGLVNIPVNLNNVIVNNDTSFNQLHKKCNNRIKYQKICPECDLEVDNEDIIRAYEYTKDEYVTFTEEDFDKLKLDSSSDIEIISFVSLNEIDPVYFEKSYYLTAKKNKAFDLLKEVLKKEKKVALAKTVIYSKFYYCIIRLEENTLILNTLYFHEEVNIEDDSSKPPKFTKEEIDLATKLVKAMSGKFNPEDYKDEYQDNIKEAIEQKLNGKAIKKSKVKPKESVTDLMQALKKSLKEKSK
ncbi:MAG TPA: Ku protein [Mollicutes bacterium]|nr:Ku protein [Mollicutes bacterium]